MSIHPSSSTPMYVFQYSPFRVPFAALTPAQYSEPLSGGTLTPLEWLAYDRYVDSQSASDRPGKFQWLDHMLKFYEDHPAFPRPEVLWAGNPGVLANLLLTQTSWTWPTWLPLLQRTAALAGPNLPPIRNLEPGYLQMTSFLALMISSCMRRLIPFSAVSRDCLLTVAAHTTDRSAYVRDAFEKFGVFVSACKHRKEDYALFALDMVPADQQADAVHRLSQDGVDAHYYATRFHLTRVLERLEPLIQQRKTDLSSKADKRYFEDRERRRALHDAYTSSSSTETAQSKNNAPKTVFSFSKKERTVVLALWSDEQSDPPLRKVAQSIRLSAKKVQELMRYKLVESSSLSSDSSRLLTKCTPLAGAPAGHYDVRNSNSRAGEKYRRLTALGFDPVSSFPGVRNMVLSSENAQTFLEWMNEELEEDDSDNSDTDEDENSNQIVMHLRPARQWAEGDSGHRQTGPILQVDVLSPDAYRMQEPTDPVYFPAVDTTGMSSRSRNKLREIDAVEPGAAFPPALQRVLTEYTYKWDRAINGWLRNPATFFDSKDFVQRALDDYGPTQELAQANVLQALAKMDEAFRDYAVPLKAPLTVFRGLEADSIAALQLGVQAGFTSTELRRSGALEFVDGSPCCLLEIVVPAGVPVIYLHAISHISSEAEVLLPRGMMLARRTLDKVRQGTTHIYLVATMSEETAARLARLTPLVPCVAMTEVEMFIPTLADVRKSRGGGRRSRRPLAATTKRPPTMKRRRPRSSVRKSSARRRPKQKRSNGGRGTMTLLQQQQQQQQQQRTRRRTRQ